MNSCTVYGMLASNDTSGINQYSNIMEYAISTDRKENTENNVTVSRNSLKLFPDSSDEPNSTSKSCQY